MFYVVQKEKLCTYLVSVVMIVLLFCFVTGGKWAKDESVYTSSETNKLLPIYSVKTDKKEVALTINCAW